ncbi:MAG: hypothetical protein IKF52_05360 [Clostridia bacterium]|nr:hypothetical protein [Clostridia bacterium]
MITKENISDNLNYIGLDLENLPEFLSTPVPIKFNISRLNNEKELKVYKYVKIKDIDIFCTTAHRDDSIKDKYSKSGHISQYLDSENEKNMDKYTAMLSIFEKIDIEGINRVEEAQKRMNENIPFCVAYERNQLWQIYYSEESDRFFMMVSTKENTYDEFFYLLKKRIENSEEEIFIPITYVNYSEEFLDNREINDLENYLWVFTKNWPISYEVYDKKEKMSLQIIGETEVYDGIKSIYKIILKSKDDAQEFYKLVKALFIMKTELSNAYEFKPKIDNNHSISFFYNDKKMFFDELPEFIKEKYNETEIAIKELNSETGKLENKLKKLKQEVKEKDAEYFLKQKEISTYLEYKKTFFGKFRYFFKSKKKKKLEKNEEIKEVSKNEEKKSSNKPIQIYSDNKKFHTIDDLVTAYNLFEKGDRYVKDLKQDIKALELRKINVCKKIENATLYINEIDKHKKSIFDFWKFANKDELAALEMGDEVKTNFENKFVKKFDFENDFEELGEEVDKLQRTKFSKEETDSIFLTTTDILPVINMLKAGEMDKNAIDLVLEQLKNRHFSEKREEETFDIFGGQEDDSTKVKYIGSKSHRENEKSEYGILNISKSTDVFDFTEKIQMVLNYLKEAESKIKSAYNMSIYKIVPISEKLRQNDYSVYDINLNNEFKNYQYRQENAIKLIKLNIKEEFPLVYLSNIIFYDNKNKTLPVGMNLSSSVLIDSSKFEYTLKESSKFKVNHFLDKKMTEPQVVYIYVDEYDLELKN